MGVDVVVIAQHQTALDSLPDVPRALSEMERVFARYHPTLQKWVHPGWLHEWYWDFLPETMTCLRESEADLHGPYGFGLVFYEYFYTIHPSPRWGAFIDDPQVQRIVCEICDGIASCLGSDRLLYVPDSAYPPSRVLDWLPECSSMDELLVRLAQHCGPPARHLGEIGRYLTDEEVSAIGGDQWPPQCRFREYNGY